ncbi:MAG: protease complex subunit PrcB family protein [Anaerovorax sp.]
MSKLGNIVKHKPGKKTVVFLVLVLVCLAGFLIWSNVFMGEETVEFRVLSEKEIPQEILNQVIPEYRTMERALACIVDGKVYVVATRGEKPTSGYDIEIKKMTLTEEDGKSKINVYTQFTDPEPNKALTQVLSYPLQVAETSLTALPNAIKLKVEYL